MVRIEFSKEVRRAGLRRAKGLCEARGPTYGFPAGVRCNASLSYGVEFDHYPVRAADGGGNDLGNCMAVCSRCHRWKTSNIDLPQLAKGRRVKDKAEGIRSRSRRTFAVNRDSLFKKKLNGEVVLRTTETSKAQMKGLRK